MCACSSDPQPTRLTHANMLFSAFLINLMKQIVGSAIEPSNSYILSGSLCTDIYVVEPSCRQIVQQTLSKIRSSVRISALQTNPVTSH